MGIALFALTGLFNNLSPATPPTVNAAKRNPGRIHPLWAVRPHACALPAPLPVKTAQRLPSLRVLQIHDRETVGTGRLVISGRMADVCAELDRLVAIEASHRTT